MTPPADTVKMATSMEDTCVIRKARPEDCRSIATLIKELACFQNTPDSARLDAETLLKDGFGEEKLFHCFVAEDNTTRKLVGHALFFFCYSAWEGVNVFLDDLYVVEEYRKRGLGTRLWREVAKVAVERGCNRVDLHCLIDNEAAVEYYKSRGATNLTETEGWHVMRLHGDKLKAFVNN